MSAERCLELSAARAKSEPLHRRRVLMNQTSADTCPPLQQEVLRGATQDYRARTARHSVFDDLAIRPSRLIENVFLRKPLKDEAINFFRPGRSSSTHDRVGRMQPTSNRRIVSLGMR